MILGLTVLELILLAVCIWLWFTGGVLTVWSWDMYHGIESNRTEKVTMFVVWPFVVFWASFGEEDEKFLKKVPDPDGEPPF